MRRTTVRKKRGAIGIGTLIIFIALILVAAIAAVVIITTAEELENKGRQSKETAKKMTASGIRVDFAEGRVTSGEIDYVYLYISLYGMEAIDMRDVVLHVVTTPRGGTASSQDLTFNEGSIASPSTTNYGTVEVNDPNDEFPYLLGERTTLKLVIDLSTASNLNTLPQSSSIEVRFLISAVGHETYDLYYTPSSYPANGGIVTLLAS
ncbi:hypothetical protein B6U83_04770 [Thermoplasmatales archaeon ex4484_36]|nr:MAG: hypothetical protein B6U83_04770 [Thermoplasmatales archaeon ex4484_36]